MNPMTTPSGELTATPQKVVLPRGFYAITVAAGGGEALPGQFALPAIQVSVPPTSSGDVEIMASHPGGWLTGRGDTVVLKVSSEAPVLITSYKSADSRADGLEIQVSRIDSPAAAPATPPKAQVVAHIQVHGDQTFPTGSWAGALGQRLWIEAFGVVPTEGLNADDIEYKAIVANGTETPWVAGGTLCGTRGQATPLVGFAVRLRGPAAERFDCVYEGAFVGGSRSGPRKGGTACRSDVLGAPLEALMVSFVPKSAALAYADA